MNQVTKANTPLWRIELLGITRAICGDRVLTRFRTAKTRDLMTYLALCGRPVPREELAAWFWSSAEEGRAETDREEREQQRRRNASLRQAVSWLAHALGEPGGEPADSKETLLQLDAFHHTVALDPRRFTTDVAEFEGLLAQARQAPAAEARREFLARALVLRRGQPLARFDCAALDYWAEGHRHRLEAAYETALAERDAPMTPSPVRFPVLVLPNRRQRLLLRLAVFPGSFSPKAAAHLCREVRAPALLAELARTGEVEADGDRFRLTPVVRAQNWEALGGTERDRLSRELAHWLRALADEATNAPTPENQAHLGAEHESAMASLTWCLDGGHDIPLGIGLAAFLGQTWARWAALEEGLSWTQKAIAMSSKATTAHAWMLYFAAGQICQGLCRFAQARGFLEEAEAEAREQGLEDGHQLLLVASARHTLGVNAYHQGEWKEAERNYADALEIFEAGGHSTGISTVLAEQGDLRASPWRYSWRTDAVRKVPDEAAGNG